MVLFYITVACIQIGDSISLEDSNPGLSIIRFMILCVTDDTFCYLLLTLVTGLRPAMATDAGWYYMIYILF